MIIVNFTFLPSFLDPDTYIKRTSNTRNEYGRCVLFTLSQAEFHCSVEGFRTQKENAILDYMSQKWTAWFWWCPVFAVSLQSRPKMLPPSKTAHVWRREWAGAATRWSTGKPVSMTGTRATHVTSWAVGPSSYSWPSPTWSPACGQPLLLSVCPSIPHLLVPFAYDVSTISVIGLSIGLLSLCPIGLLAQPYMVSSMRSTPPFVCLPILLSLCTVHLWLIYPSLSIHPSIHCLSVPSAYDVSAHLCHLSVHVCIYLWCVHPSLSLVCPLSVYLSVISLSHLFVMCCPSLSLVCPSLCFCPTVLQSVHLSASVKPSFSLSISVLLSNCPPVCPTDCESDLSSDCCLESSYAPEIPQVTAVAVGLWLVADSAASRAVQVTAVGLWWPQLQFLRGGVHWPTEVASCGRQEFGSLQVSLGTGLSCSVGCRLYAVLLCAVRYGL